MFCFCAFLLIHWIFDQSYGQVEEYYKPTTPELKNEVIQAIQERGRWFVLYYREFESDSERAVLVIDEVYQKRQTQGMDFGILRANCREDEGVCDQAGISPVGIPLLVFFHNGVRYTYHGEWEAEAIIKYAREGHFDGQDHFIDPSGEGIYSLSSKNFDKETSSGNWLIQVYAPWCRYCKELSPIWEELGEKLSPHGIKLGKIDGTIESGLADRLEVKAFPSIYYVKEGQKREFPGHLKRDLASLLAFALVGYRDVIVTPILKREVQQEEEGETELPSAVITLTDKDFLEKTKEGIWLVEFYAPWCGHCKKLVPTWERLAHKATGKFNVAKVDATENEGLARTFGIRGFPTLKLLKEGKQYNFSGQRTIDAFLEFVAEQHHDIEPTDIPKSLEDFRQEL